MPDIDYTKLHEENLPWVDVETTGLNPNFDVILEVGIVITDINLNVLDENSWVVYANDARYRAALEDMSDLVLKMHTDNNLLNEAFDADVRVSPSVFRSQAREFLASYDLPVPSSTPLCGSSVQFDRSMLQVHAPDLFATASYRNMDVSTIKEWIQRRRPDIALQRDLTFIPRKLHRVIPDIHDTLAEMRFYAEKMGI